jgi:quinol monooxygenase YgiN
VAAVLRAQGGEALYVAAYLEVRPASARQGAMLAAQYAGATRAAAGNLRIDALQEIGRNDRFVIVEAWKDQVSFEGHQKAAPTVRFREQLKSIQRGPYDQRLHRGFTVDPMPSAAGRNTIYVATHVDVPGARRLEAEALLKRLFEASLADTGRVRYDVYQQLDPRTNHFTMFAAWNSRAAFAAYGDTPHWLQYREALGPMLGALYDERLYQSVRP